MTGSSNLDLRIDRARLADRLATLARIGDTGDGGCCRIAFTDADREGRDLIVDWMRELGLEVGIDRIGNIIGLRRGRTDAAPVMTGSHIDTVGTGGRYDGAYGVVAGLEVVERLNELDIETDRPIAVVAFSNEEGVRFQPDMMGSLVWAGGMPLEEALDTIGTDGARIGDELARIGYAGDQPCGAIRPHAFVELHIEQGPVLDLEQGDLGVVVDLQGISWQEITLKGRSNHAGTTPMHLRQDAGHGAGAIIAFVRDLAKAMGGAQVGTVGSVALSPNLINVIAREAVLSVDLRNTDDALLAEAEQRLDRFVAALCAREGLEASTRRLARFAPVIFDEAIVARIAAEAEALGHQLRRMTSGAGHDAQMMARICPAAMIFVPSIGGISHNPREDTKPHHLALGADLLLRTLVSLADAKAAQAEPGWR